MNETTTDHRQPHQRPRAPLHPGGTAVANLTVAATPRRFDKASGGWVDGEAIFLRGTLWRQAAENVAESLTRSARVVVTGRLRSDTSETRDGDKRTTLELDVDDIGASLKYATITVTLAQRTSGDTDRPTDSNESPF